MNYIERIIQVKRGEVVEPANVDADELVEELNNGPLSDLQQEILESTKEVEGTLDGPKWCEANGISLSRFENLVDTDEMYEVGVEFGISPRYPWYRDR
jgi:hypothetical protein